MLMDFGVSQGTKPQVQGEQDKSKQRKLQWFIGEGRIPRHMRFGAIESIEISRKINLHAQGEEAILCT